MKRLLERGRRSALGVAILLGVGCGPAPSPLVPHLRGSIGTPFHGVLTGGAELPKAGVGYKWLRDDDRHYGLPRFVHAIERAAARVADERPGALLVVGDLSVRTGGRLLPHFSHRTGIDVDLPFYMRSLDGASVQSPGFIHVGDDGLASDERGRRRLRFDVERNWLLVRAFMTDREARIQWVYVADKIKQMLLRFAEEHGEPRALIARADEIMLEPPKSAGRHDDHMHVRTACSPAEIADGCEHLGPRRAWIEALDRSSDAERSPLSGAETALP